MRGEGEALGLVGGVGGGQRGTVGVEELSEPLRLGQKLPGA